MSALLPLPHPLAPVSASPGLAHLISAGYRVPKRIRPWLRALLTPMGREHHDACVRVNRQRSPDSWFRFIEGCRGSRNPLHPHNRRLSLWRASQIIADFVPRLPSTVYRLLKQSIRDARCPVSPRIRLSTARRPQAVRVHDMQFLGELAGVPYKHRRRLVARALEATS